MKFNIYNSENSKNAFTGKSMIRISRKAGLFTFSKTAGERIGLKEGDRVIIVQDADSPDNFYVHKTANPSGFGLRFKTANYGASFNCAKLAAVILDSTPYKSVSYILGNAQDIDGMAYHLIQTSKPLAEML